MSSRIYVFIFGVALLASLIFAPKSFSPTAVPQRILPDTPTTSSVPLPSPNLTFRRALPREEDLPKRKWDVAEPHLSAYATLVASLDDEMTFLSHRGAEPWVAASLTKLFTALVVLEDIGPTKKILISETAVRTQGVAGGLAPKEIYLARDLLKIMVLTSSNDAAVAFEEHVGGRDELVKLLTRKIEQLNLTDTVLFDGSGLSDLNQTSPRDMLLVTRYILTHHPDLFHWTRLTDFLVQPLNQTYSRRIANINPFVLDPRFLGGKTGTSEEARQNLLAIFSIKNRRFFLIVLGSADRVSDARTLLSWVERAYEF